MKVIEIGNCLPNKEPGIIISATQQELSRISGNLLYDDIEIMSTSVHKTISAIGEILGVKTLNNVLKESGMKSFTLNDIDYYTKIANEIIDEREERRK